MLLLSVVDVTHRQPYRRIEPIPLLLLRLLPDSIPIIFSFKRFEVITFGSSESASTAVCQQKMGTLHFSQTAEWMSRLETPTWSWDEQHEMLMKQQLWPAHLHVFCFFGNSRYPGFKTLKYVYVLICIISQPYHKPHDWFYEGKILVLTLSFVLIVWIVV